MRKYITLVLCFCAVIIQAQPTITKNDMPLVGDTLRTRSSIVGLGIDYEVTGNNFTWDFSSLSSNTAGADTFIAVSSTPLVYQLAFNLPFDPNKANLASPQADMAFIPNLPLTNIIDFYKSATASYGLCGFGATVAGLPVPIKFNSPDIIYKFPLTISSTPDSATVSFAQGISGLGYLSIQKKRVNIVDGWGTMITPTGSYSTLRVKSTVTETDSIYIDSLNFGIAIPRNYIEYKWLTNGKGIPVMQVSNENFIPTFTWIDSSAISSSFIVDAGQDVAICQGSSAQVTAVASGGTPPYFYIWSNGTIGATLNVTPTVTTTYTVTATDATFQFTSDAVTINVIPAPVPTISKNPDMDLGCSNSGPWPNTSFVFTAPPGYSNYTWSTGQTGPMNTVTIGPPFPLFVGPMTYTVEVVNQQGCAGSDSTNIYWDVCEGINDPLPFSGLSMYPNPCQGQLTIDFGQRAAGPVKIEVYNSLGVLICEKFTGPLGNNVLYTLDLNQFTVPKGQYFLRLSNANYNIIKALILE